MISVDFDSTLNNLLEAWVYYINKEEKPSKLYTIQDIIKWDDKILHRNKEFIKNRLLYKKVKVLIGAKEFIKELRKLDEVQIVSITPNYHIEPKMEFIKKHFGSVPIIFMEKDKYKFTKSSLLIDDNLNNLEEHQKYNNGKCIVFSNKEKYVYNRTNKFVRLGNYTDIIKYIKNNII